MRQNSTRQSKTSSIKKSAAPAPRQQSDEIRPLAPKTNGGATGSYVYDKALNKVVKVSNDIPKVASLGGKSEFDEPKAPCGRPSCDPGGCGMGAMDY